MYLTKPKAMPLRSAMPATVRLAVAPISVPLPPRQAPSDRHHHSGAICAGPPKAGAMPLITGIITATNGMLSTIAARNADSQRMMTPAERDIAAGDGDELAGKQLQQSADLDGMHHDEQADEEEDGDPFHLGERPRHVVGLLVAAVLPIVEQHQHRRAAHRDGRRLQMQPILEDQGDDHDGEHRDRLQQQRQIDDAARASIVMTRSRFSTVACVARPQIRCIISACAAWIDDDDRRQMNEKAVEA